MSRTNLAPETLAALSAASIRMFVIVELALDSGRIYLADTPFDVPWGGNVYQAARGIGRVDIIAESDGGSRGVTFTLSAVNQASIASALAEPVQGREALIRLAIVDGTTLRVDPCVWRGVMDVMSIEDDGSQPVIQVTAEHQMIAWQQPSGALFSDAEQQAAFPGDAFFEFTPQVAEATIVWPSKEFFRT